MSPDMRSRFPDEQQVYFSRVERLANVLLEPRYAIGKIAAGMGGHPFYNEEPIKGMWRMTTRLIEVGVIQQIRDINPHWTRQAIYLEAIAYRLEQVYKAAPINAEYLGLVNQTRAAIEENLASVKNEAIIPEFMLDTAQLIADHIDSVAIPIIQMHPIDVKEMASVWKIHILRDRVDTDRRRKGLPPVSIFGPNAFGSQPNSSL